MMMLRAPTASDVARFLERERTSAFSYAEVGATRGALPTHGYAIDEYGADLGEGSERFARAASALERFQNYPPGWTRVFADGDAPPREGLVFVAHIEHFGFHSLNSCRVLHVERDATRYGFSFGTLMGHEEQGEERFVVTLDPATGRVRYDVRAFSRPRGRLARLGAPVARALQRRFWRDTCEAMRRAARER